MQSHSGDERSSINGRMSAGVTRSHSHGSVPHTRSSYGRSSAKDRTVGSDASTSAACAYYDASLKRFSRVRRESGTYGRKSPKSRSEPSESRSEWELDRPEEYDNPPKWTCIRCTLENSGSRPTCEVCLFPRSMALPTTGRCENVRRKNGTLPASVNRGVFISVPDWPKEDSSFDADNSTEPRPAYRRSFSEQADSIKSGALQTGKVVSSRRSLHESYDLSSTSYVNSDVKLSNFSQHGSNLDRPTSYSNFSNRLSVAGVDTQCKLIHDKNTDRDDYWDECEGVIYALPNKGKYKDLHLRLQVSDSGVNYSYVAAPDDATKSSNEYSNVEPCLDRLSDSVAVSEVTAVTDSSNIRTSHIGARSRDGIKGADNASSSDSDSANK